MYRIQQVLGFCYCFIFCISLLLAADVCEPEFHSNVLWDVHNNISAHDIQSDPICLNDNKMDLIRRCDDGQWLPKQAPDCQYQQKAYELSELCPMNYKTISKNSGHLCVSLTDPKSWENECIFDGFSTIYYHLDERTQTELLQFLRERNVMEIWMPAKRSARYGPVIWTAAGESFGEQVEFDKIHVKLIDETTQDGEGCFSAFVQTNLTTGSIRNCSDQLNILCAFRYNVYDTSLMTLACPKNTYTVPYRTENHRCYSIHSVDKVFWSNRTIQQKYWIHSECGGNLFTMDSVESVRVFMQLANMSNLRNSDRCLFAVAPDNAYVTSFDEWRTMIENINYVNWDYPMMNGSLVVTNKYGKWNWIDHGFDCLVCQTPIEIHEPELSLIFDKKKRRLYLTIYNEEFLWRTTRHGVKCFTNADDELIKTVEIGRKKWSGSLSLDQINRKDHDESKLRKKSKAIYELTLYGEGPGYYWCEGYTMSQFDLIQSPKVVAFRREKGEVFAALINTICTVCEKFVMKNYIKLYAKEFRDHLKDVYKWLKKSTEHGRSLSSNEINIENVRIMQIEHIESAERKYQKRVVTILYHITVSLNRCDREIEYCRIFQIGTILEKLLRNLGLVQSKRPYEFISINSTEYCLPDRIPKAKDLNGTVAKIGETIPQNKLCLLPNGLPALQTCVGDFLYGGVWKYSSKKDCYLKPDPMTTELFKFAKEMANSDQVSDDAMQNISIMLHENTRKMVAADVFYLGRIMSDFSRLNNKNNVNTVNLSDTQHVFSIYNDLMYLNENTTRKSATLNSTNILLDAFDNILNGIQIDITSVANERNHTVIQVNSDDGIITTQTPNLIVYVIDPSIKNVSGVALIKKVQQSDDESNDFTDYYIKQLYANQSSDELLNENNLEIATFVPTSLLDLLNSSNDDAMDNNSTITNIPIRIVISIYYNDRLFQEVKSKRRIKSAGKVISVSIPGYGPNLPALLPTFMKTRIVTNATNSMCGYWNFENHYATWSDDGCEFIGRSHHSVEPIVLCACSHLTHYSYLIVGSHFQSLYAGEDDVIITKSHEKALDMITLLGCLLSLLGVCGITITAIIFRTWRQKPSSIVLLQLSAAIALQMILLCFVNTEYSSMHLIIDQQFFVCVALGALLQYSILVAFSWMLITAHLQFMRYVIVLGPQRSNRFFLKSFLLGWGSPLIPVVIVVIIAPNSYVQSVGTANMGGICYPSGTSLYFGLILPIGIIILANLIIFILVIYHILSGPTANIRSNKRTLAIAQLRLSVFLFFLLGLSWIFGFLASIKSGIVFSYLFCLTATIQGFVLFVYFIILDSSTRKLWRNLFTRSF